MLDSSDTSPSSEQPTRRPNKLGGLQHPSCNKGNAAQRTRIPAEGGGGKLGHVVEKAEEGIWWEGEWYWMSLPPWVS